LVDLGGIDDYETGVGISRSGVETTSIAIRANPKGMRSIPYPFTQTMYPSEVLS
jgi:hypothetical protein